MPALNNAANIKVIGVGGGGVNAVDRMIQDGLAGVEFIAVNTDGQQLVKSEAETKLDIGRDVSRGLGAGADPAVGKRAAEENIEVIRATLEGALQAIATRGYWSPYTEMPSPKAYGETAAEDGKRAYEAHLGQNFELNLIFE